MATMCFSSLGLGVAAGADVGEGDLFGVLVLVGRGLLASRVAGVVTDTDVVILNIGGRDPVDALAGGLLLGITVVTGPTAAVVAFPLQPGPLKPRTLKPGASKPTKDFTFGIQEGCPDLSS